MRDKKYCYEFPRPAVTVDVVVLTRDRRPRVLLIRRKQPPFAGAWALPGGFVDMDESLEDAARRELREETGVELKRIEQLGTFGEPGRDPRGRVISIAYLGRVAADRVEPRGADDATEAAWHDLARLPVLAFDHRQILKLARQRLRKRQF